MGLSRKQIEAFHWEGDAPRFQAGFEAMRVREHVTKVAELRRRIRESDETVSHSELRDLWDEAQFELGKVRLFGDLVLAAFFEGKKPKEREGKRDEYAGAIVSGNAERFRSLLETWRHAVQPLTPFHWEIEFPEVFGRENAGFDAVVGNPPFAGKNTVIASNLPSYHDWLTTAHPGSTATADLVAHFFRLAFRQTRRNGTVGLIATNTIREGDTRRSALRWICRNGGTIFSVQTRYRWPGSVSVIVSVIHIAKGKVTLPVVLDGQIVPAISAFLFHAGGHEDPEKLAENAGKSFQGSILLGMGFTFDDSDAADEANSIAFKDELIRKNSRNADLIFPYIGGEEVNDSPTHEHRRFAINFGEMCEEDARSWPDLMAIVEDKVKPGRMAQKDRGAKQRWWQFIRPRPELYSAIAHNRRVLVVSRVRATGFAFMSPGMIFPSSSLCSP